MKFLENWCIWDKPTLDPPHRWLKWRLQYKLGLIAKEIIVLYTLLASKPEMAERPLESIIEETIICSSAKSELEPYARNAIQMMNWQIKCEWLNEVKPYKCVELGHGYLPKEKPSLCFILVLAWRGVELSTQILAHNDRHFTTAEL